jgi:hypothetical protein
VFTQLYNFEREGVIYSLNGCIFGFLEDSNIEIKIIQENHVWFSSWFYFMLFNCIIFFWKCWLAWLVRSNARTVYPFRSNTDNYSYSAIWCCLDRQTRTDKLLKTKFQVNPFVKIKIFKCLWFICWCFEVKYCFSYPLSFGCVILRV